jgi:hypothetical protein
MTDKDMKEAFSGIVRKVPDWMLRSYKIKQALEAYNKVKEQQIQELGEAGQVALEAKIAHELAEELVARVRRGEPQ